MRACLRLARGCSGLGLSLTDKQLCKHLGPRCKFWDKAPDLDTVRRQLSETIKSRGRGLRICVVLREVHSDLQFTVLDVRALIASVARLLNNAHLRAGS